MEGRISKGHDHFKAGYSYEIVATQTNKLANQGAEEFFILGYQEMGMKLENITPSLSYRSDRVGKTMNKIEAFFEDLFR